MTIYEADSRNGLPIGLWVFLAILAIQTWIQGAKTLGWGIFTEGMAVR